MTSSTGDGTASGWDWITETDLDLGGSLTFATGASVERVMEAFGMSPAHAVLLPAARAREAIRYPDWADTYPPDHPWIRVGVTGDWAFALDDSSSGFGGYEEDTAQGLSAGTEAVLVTRVEAMSHFHYYVDGTEVTSFEPLLAWDRYGTEPDRFLPQMRQAGIRLADEDAISNPLIAALNLATLAFGIRLPRDVALGPLLTVQRD